MGQDAPSSGRKLFWIARISTIPVIILLSMMVVGGIVEGEGRPVGFREWAYLALFPMGFTLSYVLGWVKPLAGGVTSLTCMVLSQLVIGRVFDFQAYVIWGALCVPGILLVSAGLKLRESETPTLQEE